MPQGSVEWPTSVTTSPVSIKGSFLTKPTTKLLKRETMFMELFGIIIIIVIICIITVVVMVVCLPMKCGIIETKRVTLSSTEK